MKKTLYLGIGLYEAALAVHRMFYSPDTLTNALLTFTMFLLAAWFYIQSTDL